MISNVWRHHRRRHDGGVAGANKGGVASANIGVAQHHMAKAAYVA